jgi:hypothetical protein
METLNQIRRKVAEFSRLIDSPKRLSPTFGHSEQSGLPHIEVTGTDYHFVVCERGSENSRKSTTDINELLFWIFDSITFSMACDLELRNRRENEDFRIQLFQIQEDLIALIDTEYSDRLKTKYDKILNKNGL